MPILRLRPSCHARPMPGVRNHPTPTDQTFNLMTFQTAGVTVTDPSEKTCTVVTKRLTAGVTTGGFKCFATAASIAAHLWRVAVRRDTVFPLLACNTGNKALGSYNQK